MSRGINIKLAATAASRVMLGSFAARADVAARATPAKTVAHAPVSMTAARISVRVAVITPRTPMPILVAFPSEVSVQSSKEDVIAVMTL